MFAGQAPHPDASRRTGFSGNRIDRQSEARGPNVVAEALQHPDVCFYLFQDDRALLRADGDTMAALFAPSVPLVALVSEESRVLLGYAEDGGPRLAARVPTETVLPEDVKAIDLRSIAYQGLVSDADLGAIAQGRSMTGWHARHRFCANCGEPTQMSQGGYRRDCAACGAQHFPRVDPVVIMLIRDGDRALLGRSPRFNDGMYSCLAGFLEPGETVEDAVRRETFEEVGVRIGQVRYHASQPWPFPSTLMIGCMAQALTTDITIDDAELEDARWFTRDDLNAMLAREHADNFTTPPPLAIAQELIREFLRG
ncbi:MAG: NAD(+) diphosphatase [Pseudomonadota bacterium]